MICNAGRNYLVFKSDGSTFRCQCHLEIPLGKIGDIDQWLPRVDLSCLIMTDCKTNHPGEWNRASRLDHLGIAIDQGTLAGQPDNEVVTRISLTGESECPPGDWCSLFERLARRYKKCWHRIEGGDPADFQGIAQLIEKVSFLGDHLFYVTDLSSRTTRIVDVLAKAAVDCVQFTVVINPTSPDFNEIKMLGRLRLIHERGYKVNAIMPGTLETFYLFEPFFNKINQRYDIPMTFHPRVEFPEHMKPKLDALVKMGSTLSKKKEKDKETFSGL